MRYFDDKAVNPVTSMEELDRRFYKFLTNDWVHLEQKVANLEAKVHLLLGGMGTLIGLVVYTVVR